MGRLYDIIVFGSTGFTGQYVNEELCRIQGEGKRSLKWAAAGRSQNKLEASLKGGELTSCGHSRDACICVDCLKPTRKYLRIIFKSILLLKMIPCF